MKIVPDTDDAPEIIEFIESICLGVLDRYAPKEFVLIKIDNWFGSKWLGFSGNVIPHVAVWHKPEAIRIPPFVPNRVRSQRRFSGHPNYKEVTGGEPIHLHVRSKHALRRIAADCAPESCLAWYSGDSATSDRAALMVYLPSNGSYWAWYAGWQKNGSWELSESREINSEEIMQLISERGDVVSEVDR